MVRESIFSRMATDSAVSCTREFSQASWRETHYRQDPGTLCSGLTHYWLTEKIRDRSPMDQLTEPDNELLHRIIHLQSLSYYPAFPAAFNPGERDLQLLHRKYGNRNWKEIQHTVNEQHQGDFILYDLYRTFHYDAASIMRFVRLPQVDAGWESPPPGSAVMAVLRYRENSQPGGHRIAYYLDQDNQHHFFDPNAGEVVEADISNFQQWLHAFCLHANYRKLKSPAEEALLTLYILRNVGLQ